MDLAATPVTKLINGDAFYLHRSTHGDFGLFIQGEEWTNDPVGPLFEPFGGDCLLSLSLLAGARRIALAVYLWAFAILYFASASASMVYLSMVRVYSSEYFFRHGHHRLIGLGALKSLRGCLSASIRYREAKCPVSSNVQCEWGWGHRRETAGACGIAGRIVASGGGS